MENRGMDADGRPYRLEAETREIIGCAMEVLNTLGHGLSVFICVNLWFKFLRFQLAGAR
jgi:hypothetical protein